MLHVNYYVSDKQNSLHSGAGIVRFKSDSDLVLWLIEQTKEGRVVLVTDVRVS